jgi:hypothetical protein
MNQYLQRFSNLVNGLIFGGKPSAVQKSSFPSIKFSHSKEEEEKGRVEHYRTSNELITIPTSVEADVKKSKVKKTLNGEFETGEDQQMQNLEDHRDGITSIINVLGKAGYNFERTTKINDPNDIIGKVADEDLDKFWKLFDEADF